MNQIIFLDDKDISINISGSNPIYYISMYNDKNDKAIFTQISRDKLKELAEFILAIIKVS